MALPEQRYLHLAGAFAAGGWFTGLGPAKNVSAALPTVAPVHLPMVGGRSEAGESKVSRDCSKVKFGPLPKAELAKWREKKLFTLGSGYSLAESAPGMDPARSFTKSEIKSLRVDELFVKYALLNLQTSHKLSEEYPEITFGNTEISGVKLDGKELTVTVDTTLFNRYATLAKFEEMYNAGKLPKSLTRTFLQDEGRLRRSKSGYAVGSIVKSIEGTLPEGASIEPNGYVINWPKFGRIALGEVTMGLFIRRVTLIRLEHSDEEYASGCSGGSSYP